MRSSHTPAPASLSTHDSRHALETRLVKLALGWGAWLVGAGLLASSLWTAEGALRWAMTSAAFAGGLLVYTWHHLDENRRDRSSAVLDGFGAGNTLTLHRGLALAMVGGFLGSPAPPESVAWAPAVLYALASVADLFDGFLARRADWQTLLGERLDVELDGLGVFLAVALAIREGHLPPWFLPLGLARYVFASGLWWRTRQGLENHDLPSSPHRRLLAGLVMAFLSVSLWPGLPSGVLEVVGAPLAIAVLLGFARDWLVVSGRVRPTSPAYQRACQLAGNAAFSILPLILRSMIVVSVLALLEGLALVGSPTFAAMAWTSAMCIGAGFAGRASAVGLIAVLAAAGDVEAAQANAAVLMMSMMILMLGTGSHSLWKPEERYMLARLGARTR